MYKELHHLKDALNGRVLLKLSNFPVHVATLTAVAVERCACSQAQAPDKQEGSQKLTILNRQASKQSVPS